ncbi:acyltransferase [Echinicola sp. CAU 1574]|uniref:Acyltransferase n=1 Tax=Echinicola arenosa TaxID=2774144 RepID=A0ABR9AFQ7_9BACT|nr:acyltransferase [Echinicola arenosa]MBD8487531.1 acyltransferase [Echinicola arenosa]
METNSTFDKRSLGYIPHLDGLRAVAVILVMLTHANFQLGKSGIIGVQMFFSLSGFLITTLLLEEYHKHRNVSLKAFYVRRFFRLIPPLLLLLCFIAILNNTVFNYQVRDGVNEEILAALFYFYNVAWVWGIGEGLILGHMWTLGVEEQFYLIWPIILIIFIRLNKTKLLSNLLVLITLLSLILKQVYNNPPLADSLLHESLIIGCLGGLYRCNYPRLYSSPILALIPMLLLIFFGIFPNSEFHLFVLNGGSWLIGLLTTIFIISITGNKKSPFFKLFANPTLIYTGKISYSLYLWHVPIFKLFKWYSPFIPAVSFILKFLVSLILAILTWHFLEKKSIGFGRKISNRILSTSKNKVSHYFP